MMGQAQENIEAISLLGAPLPRPVFPDDVRMRLEAQLAEAQAAYVAAPGSADATLLLAQRTASLGRFSEAIAIYTEAIAAHPDDARLYRHRGHRRISLRQFDGAVADLTDAARLVAGRSPEPEMPAGAPAGAPATYTLQFPSGITSGWRTTCAAISRRRGRPTARAPPSRRPTRRWWRSRIGTT